MPVPPPTTITLISARPSHSTRPPTPAHPPIPTPDGLVGRARLQKQVARLVYNGLNDPEFPPLLFYHYFH